VTPSDERSRDLDALAGLAEDDSRVRQASPVARARLRAYRDFMAPRDLPDGARLEEAERVLGKALDRGLPGEAADAARPRVSRRSEHPAPWWTFQAPALRLALALLAVVAVAWLAAPWIRESMRHESLLRGTPEAPVGPGGASQALPGGAVRLAWEPTAAATSYVVVFLSADLVEIARVTGVRETHLDLRRGFLPPGLGSGARVLWRVSAMDGDDEISRAPAREVVVP
jgi:hypothetical protein